MSFSNHGRFRQQVRFLRRQFLQDGELPFTDVLVGRNCSACIESIGRRLARPSLFAAGHAVGVSRASAEPGSFLSCGRRSLDCSSRLTRATSLLGGNRRLLPSQKATARRVLCRSSPQNGTTLDNSAKQEWLWKGRRVLAYDGSTVSMPDTAENQQAYPQPPQQQPGLGFPLARIAAFFSLSCGAVLDLAICSYSGKGHSELGMLRQLWDLLRPGDILLADRYMCAWHEIYLLKQRGIDSVTRLHHCRRVDFRCGKRLGKGDHIVEWPRPSSDRSADPQMQLPEPSRFAKRACEFSSLDSAAEDDHCHNVAGCRGGDRQRPGRTLSCPLECRTRSAVTQANHADGHLALQDAGTRAEGNLDAHPGLQSHPHDHRSGRRQTQHRATNDQLQGSNSNTGSVSTADRHAR